MTKTSAMWGDPDGKPLFRILAAAIRCPCLKRAVGGAGFFFSVTDYVRDHVLR